MYDGKFILQYKYNIIKKIEIFDMLERLYYFRLDSAVIVCTRLHICRMFVSLKRLQELYSSVTVDVTEYGSIITITGLPHINSGRKGIKCPKGWSVSAFGSYSVTFNGPKTYDRPEQVIARCGIQFDMHEPTTSSNPMAGLTPAPIPTTVPPRHVPIAVVNGNGTITITVCVSFKEKGCFGKLVPDVISMGNALCGDITFQPTSVTYQDNGRYSLKLPDGGALNVTFHDAIAEKAKSLLQKAWDAVDVEEGRANIERRKQDGLEAMMRDSRPRANAGASCEPGASTVVGAYNPFGDRHVTSLVPMFGLGITSGNWANDADSTPSQTDFPRNVEVTSFSGIEFTLSSKERNALKKTQLAEKNAQKKADEESKRQATNLEAQRMEQRRQKFLEDIALDEQKQREADARAQREEANRVALVDEFKSIAPIVLIAIGSPTLDQFLADTQALRDAITDVMSRTAQDCGSTVQEAIPVDEEEEEEEKDEEDHRYVTVHTPNRLHIEGLRRQADDLGIKIVVYQNGNHWCANISTDDIQHLNVILRKQYIWVSAIDGGYSVQVSVQSYDALAQIRPDTATLVIEARAMQEQCSHKAQWLLPTPMRVLPMLPTPMHVLPVFNAWGNVVAYQQVPLSMVFNQLCTHPCYA
jgi:hypothetical protein